MSKKIITRVVFVIAGLLLVFLAWRLMTNKLVLISREQAIQNAIQASNLGCALQYLEQPTEFETEIMRYKEIKNSPYKGVQNGLMDVISDRLVWIVTIKTLWTYVGGPVPDPDNNEPFYGRCIIFIDAWTEKSLTPSTE